MAFRHSKARLLAAWHKRWGNWLHAIPISLCVLKLDDKVVRISVGLRRGVSISEPHLRMSGKLVDVRGSNALSFMYSSGRSSCHYHIYGVTYCSLPCADILTTEEPQGLSKSDFKRPAGVTLTLWHEGRCLTCRTWVITASGTAAII